MVSLVLLCSAIYKLTKLVMHAGPLEVSGEGREELFPSYLLGKYFLFNYKMHFEKDRMGN